MGDPAATATFDGRRLRGGPLGVARLARQLGLDRLAAFRVASVGWHDDHLDVAIATSEGRKVGLRFERPDAERAAFLNLDRMLVAYSGEFLPPDLGRVLRKHVPLRMSGLAVEDLAAALAADPDMRELAPRRKAGNRGSSSLLDTWGGEDAYADFFAGSEMLRSQLDSIDPSRFFQFIQHSDNECALVSPHGVAPVVSMVDYPWDHRVHHLDEPDAGPRRDGGAADPTDEGVLSTNLTEADVVRGNRQKVKDVLEHVAHRPNPGRKMVLFSNTCVPTVTGEDVESLVRQAARTADVPMLFLAMTPRSMHNVFRDLLLGLRRDAEATAGAPDPAAVNLVGFPDERATHELEALLGRVGIRVNCLLLPDLDVERLHRAPNAALNVFLPNKLWDTHYDHLRTDSRTPGITPPAPYGWAGTLRWLEAVVAALGVGGDPAAAWEAHVADLREGWARACERAARCRLGFIARGEDTRFLLNPAETWGIPLVEMTQEAGFGLDVLLKVHDRDDARGKALEVATLFTQPNTHQVRGFNSLELMRQRLREATCQAVLSQHFFDWRLTEAGKGRFSLQHFEMGAGGAIRTAGRLAGICATPYYRQYGRYLRRTREGLRAPAGGPAKGGA